jgi:hypothetical protein
MRAKGESDAPKGKTQETACKDVVDSLRARKALRTSQRAKHESDALKGIATKTFSFWLLCCIYLRLSLLSVIYRRHLDFIPQTHPTIRRNLLREAKLLHYPLHLRAPANP